MKTFILVNFNFVLAFKKAAFYRKHFEETSAVSDEHYEFPSGRLHGGKFKELILASFDPDLVDGQTCFYLREVVDQLTLGLAGHAHGERKKRTKIFEGQPEKKLLRAKKNEEKNEHKNFS